jgi:hypothetical protein
MLATLLIVFREVIEAGLIVGIVLAATKGVPRRGLWIGYGTVGGLAGACLVAVFAREIAALFEGAGQELFNASILLLAVAMLTWHNVWMASHGRVMAQETRQVGAAVAAGEEPLAALCGVAAGFGRWSCELCDPGHRAVCFVQRALSGRMALDLRDRRCGVALSQRLRFGRAELREGCGSQCAGSDTERATLRDHTGRCVGHFRSDYSHRCHQISARLKLCGYNGL